MGDEKHSPASLGGPALSASPEKSSRRSHLLLLGGLVLLLGGGAVAADWWTCLPSDTQATYVGRQSCIQCHQPEHDAWQGSHHDLAMDLATPENVLGDFNNAEVEHYGIHTRLFRDGKKFMVHTEGPDGNMVDLEIKYVLGHTPLQQYMVEFDRLPDQPQSEVARVQVLRVAWETEKKRWFYLRPPDVDEKLSPDDDLHWTGIAQRWNNMCADCHSTNLQKKFDLTTQRYHTTWSEIDVSCEACHGPGSVHVELARDRWMFWDRKLGYGLANLKSSNPETEIQACAKCHSRRRHVYPGFEPGKNYFDYYANELIVENSYHPDGQILDEVYVHGSFIQSKMYHKKIRCTDCHDPHTARVKAPDNRLCTSCHAHSPGKYDSPTHHHHPPGKGTSCVECHMPETTYMMVDPRRDHSLRIPRPDLSVQLDTPNACTRCHIDDAKISDEKRHGLSQYADWLLAAKNGDDEIGAELARLNAWAADEINQWIAPKQLPPHYASVLHAARSGAPEAEADLIKMANSHQWPNMVRATATMHLGQYGSRQSLAASQELLADSDPQVRIMAVANLEALPDDRLVRVVAPLLEDPVRMVRAEAGRVLAGVPGPQLTGSQRRLRARALEEYEAGVMVNSDRAAAHLSMALLYERQRHIEDATKAYETAMRIEPGVTGPRTNLAALLEGEARRLSQQAQQIGMQNRERGFEFFQRAQELGIRIAKLRREELDLLARDSRLAPDNAAIQYRYGMSLYLHDRIEESEKALQQAAELEPASPPILFGLALLYEKLQRFDEARALCRRLLELRPGDRQYMTLLNRLPNAKE